MFGDIVKMEYTTDIVLEQESVSNQAKEIFENAIKVILKDRKYFYWSLDYFSRIDNINFKHYELNKEQKDFINGTGKLVFRTNDINFSIKANTLRNEPNIKNLKQHLPNYQKHSTYLEEYILYLIISSNEELFSKTDKEQQKNNFIYVYLKFLIDNNISLSFPEYNDFNRSREYTKLMNKFESVYKLEHNNDFITELNELKSRLSTLKVLKIIESKITFLFTLDRLEDKEEIRFALDSLSNNKKELTFRGQANSNWVLDSSITRDKSLMAKEHDLFQEILALKPNEFLNDRSDYEKLITMQHYGLPTRLLDVTRNPLISIFFASNNWAERHSDGLVYIFEEKEFLHPDDEKVECLTRITKSSNYKVCESCPEFSSCKMNKDFLKKNHFIHGVAKNQRINNQSGDFIFIGLSEESKNNKNAENEVTKYLVIDYQVKKILLENLEVMNIHGGAVYPDLTNMSNYLVEKYKR